MDISPEVYEKLGVFYLGREHDLKSGESGDSLLLYDSKDLTTHAVVVGMTGSGKTGLCISLLEEAALDNIPALVIDPKGDIANLLLTFPNLSAEEFRPWINEDEARTKDLSPADYAAKQASLWKNGLASWGQDGDRIARMKAATDLTVYTPGSDAGIPVSVLSSFAPPAQAVMDDGDLLRERIESTVTGLLSLLGVQADPLQSPEHILLSTILNDYWQRNKSVEMADLIRSIQEPPFERIGVMDLESFFSAKDRFALATRLNNLIASPGFETWMSGVPLDVDSLLYGPNGEPRIAIFSIAHLSDSERQFFVSLLLNQTVGWMRTKPGTTSLRALLYIDEIFGYMPPVANPPTKQPLLTMLKQARAFGLGLVLATQNPVDLDYKGLSNTGTWFIGRLQTERDKMRVLEGLEGAAAGGDFDKERMEQILAGLGKRVFLMHNVHEPEPVIFQTRWAMSYLRGPLTRSQIKELMKDRKAELSQDVVPSPGPKRPGAAGAASGRPVVPPDIDQVFVNPTPSGPVQYVPHVLCSATVSFVDSRKGIKHEEQFVSACPFSDGPDAVSWDEAFEVVSSNIAKDPLESADWQTLPADATQARNYSSWGKQCADYLYRTRSVQSFSYSPEKLYSEPGETERDFRIRIADSLREARDAQIETLREKYSRRIDTAAEKVRKAEQKVEKEQEQAESVRLSAMVNIGTTLLSAVLGRKAVSRSTMNKASSAVRGFSRSSREKQDVERAIDDLEERQDDLENLEEQLKNEIDEIQLSLDPKSVELETIEIKPRKSDVNINYTVLAWIAS